MLYYFLNFFFYSRWHGCPTCYTGDARNRIKVGGRTMQELYAATQERLHSLEHTHGYEIHAKWECQFRAELKADPDLRRQYDDIFIPGPLDARAMSLRGGRTEPFAFWHQCDAADGEEILMLDIVLHITIKSTYIHRDTHI